ncbi:LOW QUALITY PROTEIN: STE2 Pheromone alpha factor receptor [Candida maltosa Xu316]
MDNSTIPQTAKDIILTYYIPGFDEPIELPFGILDTFQRDQSQNALVMGVTIGSASMLLIFLIGILYKTNKFSATTRKSFNKSILFYINVLILLMSVIRTGCFVDYLLGPLNAASFAFTGWYTGGSSFASSDAANWFKVILFLLIEISLVFQVYIMFKAPKLKIWGVFATVLSGLFGLVVVGFQINLAVLSHIRYQQALNQLEETVIRTIWMDLPTILFSVSINIMSVFLIGKLIIAIKTRRLKQFDSFHILLIGFTQTLILPSILLFIHYFVSSGGLDYLLVNISLMLIVLMLPLSSLWAQTSNSAQFINSSPSMSFLSRQKSAGGATLNSVTTGNLKKMTHEDDFHSPTTLRDDSESMMMVERSKPVAGIDGQLPPDIEQILNGEDRVVEDGIFAKHVTLKKM